jgi:hypothetical protein
MRTVYVCCLPTELDPSPYILCIQPGCCCHHHVSCRPTTAVRVSHCRQVRWRVLLYRPLFCRASTPELVADPHSVRDRCQDQHPSEGLSTSIDRYTAKWTQRLVRSFPSTFTSLRGRATSLLFTGARLNLISEASCTKLSQHSLIHSFNSRNALCAASVCATRTWPLSCQLGKLLGRASLCLR